MRRWRAVNVALGLVVGCLFWVAAVAAAAGAGEPSYAARLRGEGRQLRAEGHLEESLARFEEAIFESLAVDDLRGASLTLSEIGRTYERAGLLPEALQYFQSALSVDIQRRDRPSVARDLKDLGRVFGLLGHFERSLSYYGKAQAVVEGAVPVEVVVALAELACGATNEVTPKPADFTGGTWTGFGSGANEKEALQSVLNAAFGTAYQPTCKTKCPDGSAPPAGKCKGDVTSTLPSSTTPADYGSPAWNPREVTLRNGTKRTLIGPVKITKFPADIKAVQKCTACS